MAESSKRNQVTVSTTLKKKAILEAMEKSLGVVTPACSQVGIAPKTYYQWLKKDEKFREKVQALKNITHDFVESKIFELINGIKVIQTIKTEDGSKKEVVYRRAPDTTMIIFFSKTQMKHRGYIEKQIIENVQHPEDIDLSNLTDEELRMLNELQSKCRISKEKLP